MGLQPPGKTIAPPGKQRRMAFLIMESDGARVGLEPTRIATADFESAASTDFATRAAARGLYEWRLAMQRCFSCPTVVCSFIQRLADARPVT